MNITAGKLLRRKVWCTVTSKQFLLPAICGASIFYFFDPGLTSLTGLFGLGSLGLAGFSVAKNWLAGDKLTERAFRDLQRTERDAHDRYLRELRRRLRGDRDPRTSNMLKKLQRIYERLLATDRWNPQQNSDEVLADVRDQTRQLYKSCLALLERSLGIWQVSRDVATDSARQQLTQSREELIIEIQQSIIDLEQTLDHMQTAKLQDRTGFRDDASRLRTELEQGLEVARKVEKRLQDLEIDLQYRDRPL